MSQVPRSPSMTLKAGWSQLWRESLISASPVDDIPTSAHRTDGAWAGQAALPVNGHVPNDGVLVRRDLIFRPDSELEAIGRGRERQRIQGVVVRVPLVELKVAVLRLLRIWNVESDEGDAFVRR